MKITQKEIEDLGFTFRVKDEETGDDCTYNVPSKKKGGWVYCLVHHPSTNDVIISHHKSIIKSIKDIKPVVRFNLKTMKDLTDVIEKYEII
jgi:hypothetical protein